MKRLLGTLVAMLLICCAALVPTIGGAADEPVLISPVPAPGLAVAIAGIHQRNDGSSRAKDLVVEIQNRAALGVRGVVMVLAGESCTSKPAWPAIYYGSPGGGFAPHQGEPPLEANQRAGVTISAKLYESVAAVAKTTCRRAVPPDLQLTRIVFVDGSTWDLGSEIRGEPQPAKR